MDHKFNAHGYIAVFYSDKVGLHETVIGSVDIGASISHWRFAKDIIFYLVLNL